MRHGKGSTFGRIVASPVSLEDFASLRETAYLVRSPANARRLLDAMERLDSGAGEKPELVDAD